ncbi:MAG: 4-hydroxy-tetrahydrodipicolinate reductase [Flavobacteriales bacterium]|nr:4-hydroxy-tetrahydrodipicolinate reductase [Flavobacteriales bacterium]
MNIGIFGYGRMGKEIEKIAIERGHSITAKVNSNQPKESFDLSETDVIIEFSIPEFAEENIRYALDNDLPIVVGTTGWYDSLAELSDFCKDRNGALLHATNFSIGVNLFFALNKKLAALMNPFSDYEASLEEIHHTQKLDAPSGTGISLAEQVIEGLDRYDKWENVKKTETSNSSALSIESLRLPDVPGTHTVTYTSEIDTLEIKHTAHNRKGFALGSVLAAEWIADKKGIFTMSDVLNF